VPRTSIWGAADLATTDWVAGGVSVLRGRGDGTFEGPLQFGAGPDTWTVVAADLNLDGLPDIAVASFYSVAIIVNDTKQ
jgi:hypothetical protein